MIKLFDSMDGAFYRADDAKMIGNGQLMRPVGCNIDP